MQQFEVRIHFAAPSMVRNDTRWRNVAAGVARFKPVRRLRLSDSIVDSTREDVHGRDQLNSPIFLGPIEPSTPSGELNIATVAVGKCGNRTCRSPSLPSLKVHTDRDVASRKRPHINPTDYECGAAKRTKRVNSVSIHKNIGDSKSSQLPRQTPKQPQSAPEASILVPFTGNRNPPWPASGMLEENVNSGRPIFSDPATESRIDETPFNDRPGMTNSFDIRSIASPSITLSIENLEGHRFRRTQKAANRRQQGSRDGIATTISQSSRKESQGEMGSREITSQSGRVIGPLPATESEPSFITLSSAASRSAASSGNNLDQDSPLAQKLVRCPPAVVNPSTRNGGANPAITRQDVRRPVSSPGRQASASILAASHSFEVDEVLHTIENLPRQIKYRMLDTISNGPFVTSIPNFLRDLAERIDLQKIFLPVKAPARIGNTERGYWKLVIKIAGLGSMVKGRRPPLTASQWSERMFMPRQARGPQEFNSTLDDDAALRELTYPAIDPSSPSLWSAEEFMDFWAYLAKVIESGRAGFDVFATITQCEVDSEGYILIETRIYGWAETLSHLWLLLVGVSRGLAGSMPLQWFCPGEGALVTMSGQPKNGGKIGRWVLRKPGVNGYWGLQGS